MTICKNCGHPNYHHGVIIDWSEQLKRKKPRQFCYRFDIENKVIHCECQRFEP